MSGKKYGTALLRVHGGRLDTARCGQDMRKTLTQQAVVYIYYSPKAFYVGQTNQFLERHDQHRREIRTDYTEFTHVMVLFGQYVNGSSLNDLERLLITYLTADHEMLPSGQRRVCRNRTAGNRHMDYPEREEVLSLVLAPFWEGELRAAGLSHGVSLAELRQSILFKYSPFTELSGEQEGLIRDVQSSGQSFLVCGTAGTGKTVVLTNLAARLCDQGGERRQTIGVAVKSNWVKTARRIFRAYGVQDQVTVGTPYQLIKSPERFDLILVDEAHRLRWNCSKQNHLMSDIFDPEDPQKHELFLLGEKSGRLVLFYDPIQAIRPSDIPRRDFLRYVREHGLQERRLTAQFRVQVADEGAGYTAEDYVNGICAFLQLGEAGFDPGVFQNPSPDAYFGVVDSIHALFEYVDGKRQHYPSAQCRVLAGYARPWVSKYKPGHRLYAPFDWKEAGGGQWKWNSTHESWIARPGSEDEIGSIHAVQGVDLDYAGVVVARDLTVCGGVVAAAREHYYDVNGTPPKGSFTLEELSEYIRQIYYVLLTRAIRGVRVYFEDPAVKQHFMQVAGLK